MIIGVLAQLVEQWTLNPNKSIYNPLITLIILN